MPIFKNAAQYRIGDFARFLGVTPDFLKHYEEKGLLKAQHKKNGYRFFGFEETYNVNFHQNGTPSPSKLVLRGEYFQHPHTVSPHPSHRISVLFGAAADLFLKL